MDLLTLIIIILVVLWLLGGFAFHIGGSLIHILIVLAVIILIIRLIQGRKVL
ncbi:MAG TPA: lmo0937 family membrane protein [Thermoanaerobaculia bacterium]|nr:lmo0937 family membrane protein [Thermoanaerobaculia bacterium]